MSKCVIITATWKEDLDRFRLMRHSLERSQLADLDHYVIVQTEDLPMFQEFVKSNNMFFLGTADVLPEDIESKRLKARKLQSLFGRAGEKLCGSLNRKFRWPLWPSYTGWHTQQIVKLAQVQEVECDYAIVIDSDVIVTERANVQDLLSSEADVVCLATWQKYREVNRKVKHWIENSFKIFDKEVFSDTQLNTYYDTPFVLKRSVVVNMLRDIEKRSKMCWWEKVLNSPARKLSEFGLYKTYLEYFSGEKTEYKSPDLSEFVYDMNSELDLTNRIHNLYVSKDKHYITVHAQRKYAEKQNGYINALHKRLM